MFYTDSRTYEELKHFLLPILVRLLPFAGILALLFILPGGSNQASSIGNKQNLPREIRLDPNRTQFNVEEKITGYLVNNSGRSIYIVRNSGAPLQPLQKWDGQHWHKVDIRRSSGSFIQVVSYTVVENGAVFNMNIPAKRLRQTGHAEGTYRFSIRISPDRSYENAVEVLSPKFHIE